MKFIPIKSALEFHHDSGIAPKLFTCNMAGPFGHIQSELNWMLYDFCRIHQIVFNNINFIENQLDVVASRDFSQTADDEESDEWRQLNISRIRDAVVEGEFQNKRIVSFLDQMMVVGLWAICEQFLGRVYREFRSVKESCDANQIESPYRWNDFLNSYSALGMDITRCDNFLNANEARVLNNAIKHKSIVEGSLEGFAYFNSYGGRQLAEVPLETQRYLTGVSDFIGSLIKLASSMLEN